MKLEIRFLIGARAGEKIIVEDVGPVQFGRGADSHVTFDAEQDRRVSVLHAEIRAEPDGLYLYDLGSANGTFIGQERVQRVKLSPRQQITFGQGGPRILLELHDQPAAAQQTPSPAPRAPVPGGPAPRKSRAGLIVALVSLGSLVCGGVTLAVLRPAFLTDLWESKNDESATTPDGGIAGGKARPDQEGAPPVVVLRQAAPTVIDVSFDEVKVKVTPEAGGKATKEGCTLTVPPGAVKSSRELLLRRLKGPFPRASGEKQTGKPHAVVLAPVYDLGPDGARFEKPVTVTVRYDPAALPADTPPEQIRLAYFDGKAWIPIRAALDTKAHTLRASFSSFPGVAMTALAAGVGLVILNYLIWTKTPAATNIKDLAAGEVVWSDPVSRGEASQYVTPNDPVVKARAARAIFLARGTKETRPLDAPDLATWVARNHAKDVVLVFKDGGGTRGVTYDDSKKSNWQKPSSFFSKGSRGPMSGDCTDVTNGLVSVLRARGIKAKGVFGYQGGDVRSSHAWGEVELGGEVFYLDTSGRLQPLSEARKVLKYFPPRDPSDPRHKSMWDENGQRAYTHDWHMKDPKPPRDAPEPEPEPDTVSKNPLAPESGTPPKHEPEPPRPEPVTPPKHEPDPPRPEPEHPPKHEPDPPRPEPGHPPKHEPEPPRPEPPGQGPKTARGGHWKMAGTVSHPKKIGKHQCYTTRVAGGEGSVTLSIDNLCMKPLPTKYSGTVTWSRPPARLVPGQVIVLRGQAKTNVRDTRLSQGTYLSAKADYTSVSCGGLHKAGIKIGHVGTNKYKLSASLKKTFKVPDRGFVDSAKTGNFGLFFCSPHYNHMYRYTWVQGP